ncbi:sensor histidine kinase [Desulfovibrio sp. QI0430]
MQDKKLLQVISNFTHQIINPINGVIGTLDNVCDGTIKPHNSLKKINAARSQLESIVAIIRNFDFFAKLSIDGTFVYDGKLLKRCIVPQVIIQASQFFQEQAMQKKIEIRHLNRDDQHIVLGNHDLLRQVFINIFDNAVKYSKEHSIVEVKSWIQNSTKKLIVEVITSSIPFDNSTRGQLFDLGFRDASAQQHTLSGSGIGLYICKRIMEDIFKGSIDMEYDTKFGKCRTLLYFPESL